MLTFGQYVKDILNQIKSTHDVFLKLQDEPGDLDTMRKEWIKIDSLLRSLIKRIDNSEKTNDLYQNLVKKCRYYVDNYDFKREIEIMSGLYAEDFNDKKFLESINETIEKLE